MRNNFLSMHITIIGLITLGADYAYADCSLNGSNLPTFVCIGEDSQNHIFSSQGENPVSVILNSDYLNTLSVGEPLFKIDSDTDISFEQRKGSVLNNVIGNGLFINSTNKGNINLSVSGDITSGTTAIKIESDKQENSKLNIDISGNITADVGVDSQQYVTSGNAITEIKVSGDIHSINEALLLNNSSETDDALMQLELTGNIAASKDYNSAISLSNSTQSENGNAIIGINMSKNASITSNGSGIDAFNSSDNSANALLDIAGKIISSSTNISITNMANTGTAKAEINLQENAKLLSSEDSTYGIGLHINNNSHHGDAIVLVKNAGTIDTSSHGVNILNATNGTDSTALLKFELTDTGKITSNNDISVNINNYANKTATMFLDIAGDIQSKSTAMNITNSGTGQNSNTFTDISITESATISSSQDAVHIYNYSSKETILNLGIAGDIQANDQALQIYNSAYGEGSSSISNVYIAENATISTENASAVTIYNTANKEAISKLTIKGEILAGDQYAMDLTNQGGDDIAQVDLIIDKSTNIVSAGGAGIKLNNSSAYSAYANMYVAGNIESVADSIYLYNNVHNQDATSQVELYIADSAKVTSEQSSAIHVTSSKDINIVANGSIVGTTGISISGGLYGQSNETAKVQVGGKVTGTDGIAINMSDYIGESAMLALTAGWNIEGQTIASRSEENYLMLTGDRNSFLDLSRIDDEENEKGILGFNHFVKEGASIWYLTNSLEHNKGFESAKITYGGIILDNATFAMDDSANNAFTIESAATVYNSGNSSIIGDVNNSGIISFSAPVLNRDAFDGPIGTLTINGNYHGNNGYLVMNTELANDYAQTDRLIIEGDTSGSTKVIFNNRDGMGDQTQNGIEIIEVNGNSDSNAFSLAGDYTLANGDSAIVAGAYAYTLQQHDLATGSNGNWYLRSTQLGANTPMHEVYPRVLLALNGLPTLKTRTGGRYWQETPISQYASYIDVYYAEQADTRDLWVRMDREFIKFDPKQSATESAYDINSFTLQIGYDGFKRQTDNGTLIAGVNVHLGRAQANTTSYFGDGRIHTNAYGFGFTGTWYDKDGYYIDGQSKFNWLRSDLTSKETHTTLEKNNNGFGYAFGIEAGKRINIDEQWTLTPQAQLTWSSVNFNWFNDIYGAKVSLNKGDSLQARLGLAIENQTSWQDKNGELSHRNLYGIANFYTELMDETKITVDDVSLINKSDRNWAEIGLGMNYGWDNNRYNAFVELSSRSSLKDFADTYAVKGTVGLKINF